MSKKLVAYFSAGGAENVAKLLAEVADADLFEKSDVEAVITTKVDRIKKFLVGCIQVPELGGLIMDDTDAKGEVLIYRKT